MKGVYEMENKVTINIMVQGAGWAVKFDSVHSAVRWIAQRVDSQSVIDVVKGNAVVMSGRDVFKAAVAFEKVRSPWIDRGVRSQAMRDWQKWCSVMKAIDSK